MTVLKSHLNQFYYSIIDLSRVPTWREHTIHFLKYFMYLLIKFNWNRYQHNQRQVKMKIFKHLTDLIFGLKCNVIRTVIRKMLYSIGKSVYFWKALLSNEHHKPLKKKNTQHDNSGLHNIKYISKTFYIKLSHLMCWSRDQEKKRSLYLNLFHHQYSKQQ